MLIQLGNRWIRAQDVFVVLFSKELKRITVLYHDNMQATQEDASQEMADEFVYQVNQATKPPIHSWGASPTLHCHAGYSYPPIYSSHHQQRGCDGVTEEEAD